MKELQKDFLEYIDKYLSPNLCGYRKGYSTQTALISMLEKWKLSIKNKGFAGGVLMDLSKTFDTINHPLYCWQSCMIMDSANRLIYNM